MPAKTEGLGLGFSINLLIFFLPLEMALQGLSELLQVSLSLEALSAPLRGSPRPWPGIINKLGYLDSV